MGAPVVIEALGRDDLAALVRLAIMRGGLVGDEADVALARCLALKARADELKHAWEQADRAHREAMCAADALQDHPHRWTEFMNAVEHARATGDLLRTAHRIWRRADDRAWRARRAIEDFSGASGAKRSEIAP